MNKEIFELARQKGLLIGKDVFDILETIPKNYVKKILEKISLQTKMITLSTIQENSSLFLSLLNSLSESEKNSLHHSLLELKPISKRSEKEITYRIFYADTKPEKKLELKDFVQYFRARYSQIQRILLNRSEIQNDLVSINKISSDRQNVSIIGMVTSKSVTKNKNLIIEFEDLTGRIKALVKQDSKIFELAQELQLDDVVAVKGSGNNDFLYVQDIFFPDAFIHQKTKFENDVNVVFLSDLHTGSDRHLEKSFNNFLNWINSDDPAAKKVKFIFFSGDNVDGVGIFPNQEEVLSLKSMNLQYKKLASYLKKIPKRITMFMIPGQHDATRVAEPQPVINQKYAPELYEIENLILVTNPSMIKLYEGEKEFKILLYHGASLHTFINEIKELRELKAHRVPAKAVRHMLKRRHLAPTHGEVVYIPNSEKDPLVIDEVPDVIALGEVHRLDIESYNGVLIIVNSCWQAQTPFEEKVGNIPDPGKVPILNLKTRELKVYDFTDPTEVTEGGVFI